MISLTHAPFIYLFVIIIWIFFYPSDTTFWQALSRIVAALESEEGGRSSTGKPRRLFSYSEIIHFKTSVYDLCTNSYKGSRVPNPSAEVYRRYEEVLVEYIKTTTLPAILKAKDRGADALLKEYVRRWQDYEVLTFWCEKFFMYLQQWFCKHARAPTLKLASIQKFRTLVYAEIMDDLVAIIVQLVSSNEGAAGGSIAGK